MKSLLSISILSVVLSMCNQKAEKTPKAETVPATEQTIVRKADAPVLDGATDEEKAAAPTAEKPRLKGAMPDTARRQVIQHGAPDKARNDSVKASKTKGKF